MYNITHTNTAVSAEEMGMVEADGRTKANHHFKCRGIGAVTEQLHGSIVARTIPKWNRLPAAAADAVSPTSFHSQLDALPANFWPRGVYAELSIYPMRDTPLAVIRQLTLGGFAEYHTRQDNILQDQVTLKMCTCYLTVYCTVS